VELTVECRNDIHFSEKEEQPFVLEDECSAPASNYQQRRPEPTWNYQSSRDFFTNCDAKGQLLTIEQLWMSAKIHYVNLEHGGRGGIAFYLTVGQIPLR